MALSATVLSAAIKSNLLGNANAGAVNNAALQALCDEIAAAVVDHIKTAAVVSPTTAGAPSMNAGVNPVTGVGEIL